MKEVLTNLTNFWNMKEKTDTYQVETDAISNVVKITSKKLKKNELNSHNHMKKELTL